MAICTVEKYKKINRSSTDSEKRPICGECDSARNCPVDNWFRRDQMKVIVQSKWSNPNQFAAAVACRLRRAGSVGAVCVQRHVSSLFYSHRLWLARFFLLLSEWSALFFRPSERDNRDKLANWLHKKESARFEWVCFYFRRSYSLFRWTMHIGTKFQRMLWFCFLVVFFTPFTFASLTIIRFGFSHHKHHLSNRNFFSSARWFTRAG